MEPTTSIVSKLNKLPKPTNFQSLYLLAQQAFEDGFRGMTVNELVVYLSKNLPEDLVRSEFIYEEAKPAIPLTDPGRNASMFAPAGTYTTPSGTLELTKNFNVIGWNGDDWEKLYEIDIAVPPAENRIEAWIEGSTYYGGVKPDQKTHNGQIWSVKTSVVSTDEKPGIGEDWIADLDKIGESDLTIGLSENLLNKSLIKEKFYVSGVETTPEYRLISTSADYSVSPILPVDIAKGNFIQGLSNLRGIAANYQFLSVDKESEYDNTKILGGGSILNGQTSKGFDISDFPIGTLGIRFTLKTATETDSTDYNTIMYSVENSIKKYVPYSEEIKKIKGIPLGTSDDGIDTISQYTTGKLMASLGDSLTSTEGKTNWVTYACERLNMTFTNFATNGAGFCHIPNPTNPRQYISKQIDDLISSGIEPDIIDVSVGRNDYNDVLGTAFETMQKNIEDLDMTIVCDAARSAFYRIQEAFPNAKKYYGLPVQEASNSLYDTEPPLITELRKLAERYAFKVIEATYESGILSDFEVPAGQGRYLYDGLHPDENGKRLLGNYYASVIGATYLPEVV